jgi:hypothetical protein
MSALLNIARLLIISILRDLFFIEFTITIQSNHRTVHANRKVKQDVGLQHMSIHRARQPLLAVLVPVSMAYDYDIHLHAAPPIPWMCRCAT